MDDANDKDFKIKIYLVTITVVLAGYPFPHRRFHHSLHLAFFEGLCSTLW
jgi:hypothetical protein